MQSFSIFSILSLLVSSLTFAATGVQPPKSFGTEEARKQLTLYLSRANERMNSFTKSERREYFSYRDAKKNQISLITDLTDKIPLEWALKSPELDGFEGTSTERLYQEFNLVTPDEPVIVAVIDSGVDINHEGLSSQILVNEEEKAGTADEDLDSNGFAHDVFGWNFLGGKDGRNVEGTTLEVTREMVRLQKKESEEGLTPDEQKYFERVQEDYNTQVGQTKSMLERLNAALNELETALDILRQVGLQEETIEAIRAIQSTDPVVQQAQALALNYLSFGLTTASLRSAIGELDLQMAFYYNLDFDSSVIIGDDPAVMDDVGYGNSDVITGTAMHGTHVSGIIGAVRDNGKGMNGQSKFVKILPVRAVADGDERDKDVANAVIYAVDRGARILSMSFGKKYSPHKEYVDEAFRYAERNGVLVVHAAGNDSADTDHEDSFPNRWVQDAWNGSKRELTNWIEVAASSAIQGEGLPASFSNYGRNSVHVFAPGHLIYSTLPGNQYGALSGTSMAAPEVSGVAALLWSQYPEMTAQELRKLILDSVRRYDGLRVYQPGTMQWVDFTELSVTGGVVDAWKAFKSLLKSGS